MKRTLILLVILLGTAVSIKCKVGGVGEDGKESINDVYCYDDGNEITSCAKLVKLGDTVRNCGDCKAADNAYLVEYGKYTCYNCTEDLCNGATTLTSVTLALTLAAVWILG